MRRKTHILLSCGLVALIVAAAVLTQLLLREAVPEKVKTATLDPTKQPHAQRTTLVSQAYIELEPPTKLPIKKREKPAPQTSGAAANLAEASAGENASAQAKLPRKAAPAPRAVGVVIDAKGYAFATGQGGQLRPLSVGSRIYLDETVNTAPEANARIKFDDGTTLSQGESSATLIDRYLYDPADKNKTEFGMCFLNGICHLITGAIVEVNPEKFKVRTRLATVGIRGCELAFRSAPERDDLYILSFSDKEHIRIETTTDGSQTLAVHTNQEAPVDASKKKTIDVAEPGTVYTIFKGIGMEQRAIGVEETSRVVSEAIGLAPAQHNMSLTPDGAVFAIKPLENASTNR